MCQIFSFLQLFTVFQSFSMDVNAWIMIYFTLLYTTCFLMNVTRQYIHIDVSVSSCPGFFLSRFLLVPVSSCPGFFLSRFLLVPVSSCPGFFLSRFLLVPVSSCPGFFLSRFLLVPVSSCPGFFLSRFLLVPVSSCPGLVWSILFYSILFRSIYLFLRSVFHIFAIYTKCDVITHTQYN